MIASFMKSCSMSPRTSGGGVGGQRLRTDSLLIEGLVLLIISCKTEENIIAYVMIYNYYS